MEQLETRKFLGLDFGRTSLQFSVYDEGVHETHEESFPVAEDEGSFIENGLTALLRYMQVQKLHWDDYSNVVMTMEEPTDENRDLLSSLLPKEFKERNDIHIITMQRAFVEYVFHQEKMMWDRNTLLFDYTGDTLNCVLIDQLRRSRKKGYRAEIKTIDLAEEGIFRDAPDRDQLFSKMIRQFLAKNSASIIYLTGDGFEGNWMKKTLTCMCAGRRVFMGQNLYANGSCLLGLGTVNMMREGMILCEGPDMVYHTVGVITSEGGKANYVPITTIGKEWYNTRGSMDIIMDKSQRVEFFYHNTVENEIEVASCELEDIPKRPPKTTRLRLTVEFSSPTEGTILIEDMGFGQMFPGTHKITMFPFGLIS